MLSKPSLEPSAGSSGVTSTSSASRSRMALAYSVRLSRCSAGVSRLARRDRRPRSSRASSAAANASSALARRTRRAARRHHAGLDLADDLLPRLGVGRRRCRQLERVEHEAADLRALVVAGEQVLLQERRHRRLAAVACAAGRVGGPAAAPRRPSVCAAGVRRGASRCSARRPTTSATATIQTPTSGRIRLAACAHGVAGPVPIRFLISAIELGFGLAGMRGEEHAFRPRQRRAAFLVLHVELRALLDEEPDDVVGAAVGGAHQRREPHRVDGVDVHAELVTELDRLEQRCRPFVERLVEHPVDAGRRHQRRRAAERRECADRRRASSSSRITVRSPASAARQERRLPGEVHPRQRAGDAQERAADRRHFLHPRVRVGALVEQHLDQLEQRRAVDAVHERGVVHVHVARFDRRPQRRAAVPVDGAGCRRRGRSGSAPRRGGC